jgi:hypothetical protein
MYCCVIVDTVFIIVVNKQLDNGGGAATVISGYGHARMQKPLIAKFFITLNCTYKYLVTIVSYDVCIQYLKIYGNI